jgi:hypothetical protein
MGAPYRLSWLGPARPTPEQQAKRRASAVRRHLLHSLGYAAALVRQAEGSRRNILAEQEWAGHLADAMQDRWDGRTRVEMASALERPSVTDYYVHERVTLDRAGAAVVRALIRVLEIGDGDE